MKDNLKNILSKFSGKKVIVWGDLILDEYIYTSTSRISREAPVLVTEFEADDFKLGGAGNVVMNLKSLGATPIPVAFTGKDRDGEILLKILKQNSITTEYLVDIENFKTPKKSRILSGGENTKKQQVLRIDKLNKYSIEKIYYQKLEENLKKLLAANDMLLISDYLHESVRIAIYQNIKQDFPSKCIIADSRRNLLNFKSVTIATPNEPEIKNLFPEFDSFSDKDLFDAGEKLLKIINAEGIILKRGHQGITVFELNKNPRTINIYGSSEIVDVTGAGDTVISVFSLAMLTGADLFSSAHLANIAAGIVVMKEGAYPINFNDLSSELE